MIKLIDVCKIYKTKDIETKALNNINIEFDKSGFTFILGPSGSGKTTLLNVIGGLDKASSGDILIDDISIKDYSSKKYDEYRNTSVGFIFQQYNLIDHLNVYDNIALPLRIQHIKIKDIKKEVEKILDLFGLADKRNKYPNQLSGGEKQRVAIARALVTQPKIILADEPTGALDSKNSEPIMEELKKISKTKLVVMVSHSEELAKKYADRIIRLKDGEIISDERIENKKDIESTKEKRGFKFISLLTSIKLSFRNMYTKWIRTLLTILATAVGIVSTTLVLMVSNSMTNYTEFAQKQALGSYPITISSRLNETDEIEHKDYEEYPSSNIIHITNEYTSYYKHVNIFDSDYLDYVKALDKNLYTVIDYGSSLNMHILSLTNAGYELLSTSSYLKSLNEDNNYLSDEYDLLYGSKYPSEYNEVALVIDKNNCIDAYVLDYLGIDYKDIESYTFEDMCNKEFKVISNNQYYKYDDVNDKYVYNYNYEDMYNAATITLKISAILRIKKTATTKLYQTGLLFTNELENMMHIDAVNSDIVVAQLAYGTDKNVFTGKPYEDREYDFQTLTKEYQLESNLRSIGYYYNISSIRIYTDRFENRNLINKYLQAYNIDKGAEKQVIYRDYMGTITEEFEKFVKILTNVLIIFSMISLIVSSIMIALLMYISVVERTKEIGLLRCLGFSKINVGTIFLTEASAIGFTSGVIGVIIARVAIKPILNFVSSVVEELYSNDYDISELTRLDMNITQIILLILGAVLIAVLAALIPSIIASVKEPVKSIRHQGD